MNPMPTLRTLLAVRRNEFAAFRTVNVIYVSFFGWYLCFTAGTFQTGKVDSVTTLWVRTRPGWTSSRWNASMSPEFFGHGSTHLPTKMECKFVKANMLTKPPRGRNLLS